MDDGPFSEELRIACLAVQRASILTELVAAAADRGTTEKADKSVVTIADFAAQALLISAIHNKFPSDGFVGEESATALQDDHELLDRVWGYVSTTHLDDPASDALLATPASKMEMLDIISLGKRDIPSKKQQRFWILDPVDGTSTYLRGQQYAVCLALFEHGKQKIGVLGCPRISAQGGPIREDADPHAGHGVMLFAVAGMGTYARPMGTGHLDAARKIKHHENITANGFSFVDSPTHPAIAPDKHQSVAKLLEADWPGTDLWAMQVKYAALALGQGNVVIRIPCDKEFRPYVWDHAGGQLVFEEAGGIITDAAGKPFDFTIGTRLENNYGLVAAQAPLHKQVVQIVKEFLDA